ncbi:hypothetical protein QL996_03255 [Planococcus sp. APC 4015]|nr:hypothetical protein [Planococcus sp. APC 4015]
MTTDAIRPAGRDVLRPRFGDSDTFRQLPTRRAVAEPAPSVSPRWTLIDLDRYEVHHRGATLGFIDVVGAVFVVLAGPHHAIAVEVAQTLVFDDALRRLQESA